MPRRTATNSAPRNASEQEPRAKQLARSIKGSRLGTRIANFDTSSEQPRPETNAAHSDGHGIGAEQVNAHGAVISSTGARAADVVHAAPQGLRLRHVRDEGSPQPILVLADAGVLGDGERPLVTCALLLGARGDRQVPCGRKIGLGNARTGRS